MDALPAAFEERWARWLLESNRRRTRIGLFIACALLPFFGALDYILAPSVLRFLWGVRAVVLLVTFAAFPLLKTRFFDRYSGVLSSAYVTLIAFSISAMTLFMGGLASPYYAGLSLVIIGPGSSSSGLRRSWR